MGVISLLKEGVGGVRVGRLVFFLWMVRDLDGFGFSVFRDCMSRLEGFF